MTALLALFPGARDGIILRTSGGSVCACVHCLPALGITSSGLWRLDWPEDEKAPPVATKLADLPAPPDL